MASSVSFFIKFAVRTLFTLTARSRALAQAAHLSNLYQRLANTVSPEAGARPIEVPPMQGVDEDMRWWSFFMILEHNTIVNRSISAKVRQLANGEPLSGAAVISPKHDVMPASSAGPETVGAFLTSIRDHIEATKKLPDLRGTRTATHPIFGEFDAHRWNCMFSFHLKLHLPQAEHVAAALR
jgi:hypothetical protein